MIIAIGHSHGSIPRELDVVKLILADCGVDCMLLESLESTSLTDDAQIDLFLQQNPNKSFSLISFFGEVQPYVALAKSLNVPAIGCDLKNMGRQKPIDFTQKLTPEVERYENELLLQRETHQVKKVLDCANKFGCVVVIVGAYHLRENSLLRNCGLGELYLPTFNDVPVYSSDNVSDMNKLLFTKISL